MEKKKLISRCSAILLALSFGIFLLYGTLSSNDFPRGIYLPPSLSTGQSWQDMDTLGVNLVWTNAATYSNLQDLLDTLNAYDMQAVMKKNGNSGLGYLLQYYSNSQYMRYEVELDCNDVVEDWNLYGTGYYFFNQMQGEDDPTMPGGGGESWFLNHETDSAGVVFWGPDYTPTAPGKLDHEWFPGMFNTGDSTAYKHRIRVAADLTGLSSGTNIFKLFVRYLYRYPTGTTPPTGIKIIEAGYRKITAGDFNSSLSFEEFSWPAAEGVGDTIYKHWPPGMLDSDTAFAAVIYRLYWYDNCDLWVDWIESMDMDRGYNFYWTDSMHQEKLDSIYVEAYEVQQTCDTALYGFMQSDVTRRMTFTAHNAVNDTLRMGDLKPGMAINNWEKGGHRRFDHFILVARPQTFSFFHYPFSLNSSIGDQTELDTLAHRFQKANEACADTLDWTFTAQANRNTNPTENLRDPTFSEITAEAFMALAYGAKGLSYYSYRSSWDNSGTQVNWGLVDTFYAHTDTPYVNKWNAVRDVFAQLDSIGGILEGLEREAAYCATNPDYQSPVTGISFPDDETDYIEVGQFQDASNDDYLILVNRRTNGDRDITVTTNLNGNYSLRDLYTQEQFISSTGNFQEIPFDSGEGRVLKFESFADSNWTNIDRIVLADTFYSPYGTLNVAAGCTIRATETGTLSFDGMHQLICNGSSGEGGTIVFTSVIPDSIWRGIIISRTDQQSPPTDTLEYVKIEYAYKGLILSNNSNARITHCFVDSCTWDGINCDHSDFIMEDTEIGRCNQGVLLNDDAVVQILNSQVHNCYSFGIRSVNSDLYIDSTDVYDCYLYDIQLLNSKGELNYCNTLDNYFGILIIDGSVGLLGNCTSTGNDKLGVAADGGSCVAIMLNDDINYLNCGYNTIEDHEGYGVYKSSDATIHLGLTADKPGCNTITNNASVSESHYDVINDDPSDTIFARYNYWNYSGNAPADSQFYGNVDSSHWLVYEGEGIN